MSADEAKFWLDVIGGIMGAVWLASAWFTMSTGRVLAEGRRGAADVAQDPAKVLQRVAREFTEARPAFGLQRTTIESITEREIRWSAAGPFAHRGTVRVSGSPGRAHVEWEIGSGRLLFLWLARATVVLGAAVGITLYVMLREWAVGAAAEGTRVQVVQMTQAVHLLWPPFLFAGLARKSLSLPAEEVRRIVQNAPFA